MAAPIIIDDPEAIEIASNLAVETGQSIGEVVLQALREKQTLRCKPPANPEAVREILARAHSLPLRDPRPPSEILNELYDENGLFR